jgi:putative ABC transport system substrate-binding protein
VRRRDFIGLFGGVAAAWPLAARAQQTGKVWRIGLLLLGNAEAQSLRHELSESLRQLGYVEGQNVRFEVRSAEGKLDLLPNLAAQLVALRVDVIVALFTPCALAAKRATNEIPIVFLAGDAVGLGIVHCLVDDADDASSFDVCP